MTPRYANVVKEKVLRNLPPGLNFVLYLAWGLLFCTIAGSVGYGEDSIVGKVGVHEGRGRFGDSGA